MVLSTRETSFSLFETTSRSWAAFSNLETAHRLEKIAADDQKRLDKKQKCLDCGKQRRWIGNPVAQMRIE